MYVSIASTMDGAFANASASSAIEKNARREREGDVGKEKRNLHVEPTASIYPYLTHMWALTVETASKTTKGADCTCF